jgi:hypothetical protein
VDTYEKKQDWFLNRMNDGLAYAFEARDFVNFQDMVNNALVHENRREIMECSGRCSVLELKEVTRGFVTVLPHRDLSSILVSRSDSLECKLVVKDFKLPNGRFNAPTSCNTLCYGNPNQSH